MSTIILEIMLIIFLVLLNGVLAISEISVISSRRARLQQRAEAGDRGARTALELAAEPTRFLSTVQIGITLVGILAGAYGGATLAEQLALRLAQISWIGEHSETVALAIVVAAITYLSLVFGELLPKRLALGNPERIASIAARPMRLLSTISAPIVHVLSATTDALIRIMGIRHSREPPVTMEEVKILLEQGESAGVFEPEEQDIVVSALHLDDIRVSAIVTPRMKMVWLDADAPADLSRAKILESPHRHFPVARGTRENIIGIVRGRDVLARELAGEPVDLEALSHPAEFVPESQSVLRLLELFKKSGHSMVIVVDEFGGVLGLVTLTNVVEALVGQIRIPGADHEPLIQAVGGGWTLEGRLSLRELLDLLDVRTLHVPSGDYDTLGGFVMTTLGRVPSEGDSFVFSGYRFVVAQMEGKRVRKVRVDPLSTA